MQAAPIAHNRTLNTLLALALLANCALWFSVRYVKPVWLNVPPPPSETSAIMSALGDPQFAYRSLGLSLQNLGDTGGRIINLSDYNYEELGRWFLLQHNLDPVSNFTPSLAAYFFGANRQSSDLGPIVDYLEQAGDVDAPQKWRWLAHAVFIARHKMKDYDRAYELAEKLAAMDRPDMPSWTKQMPAFVKNNQGEKEAAMALMLQLLETEKDTLHPSDVNAIVAYICEQILPPDEAKTYKLCQNPY